MRFAATATAAICLALAGCARAGITPGLSPLAAVPLASNGGYALLYSFGHNGKRDDGREPVADLIAAGGELYGTTEFGGTTNAECSLGCGTLFNVSLAGKEQVLYRFSGGNDGAMPAGGVIEVNGKLYGTTSAGGSASNCTSGCGTVFETTPDGKSESVLYRFQGGRDGAVPLAGLVSLGGSLYGTTEIGGHATALCATGCGTVFKITPSGTESVLYRFTGGADGALPISRLTAFDGTLYGTTQYGGKKTRFCATGCGTLFALSASGVKRTLHLFTYAPTSDDGAYPAAGPTASNGDLYGTTLGGGGIGDGSVFKFNLASGGERVIHSFACCATKTDGAYPIARLTNVGGVMYGTTRNGGTGNRGTIFIITASGAESVLYNFTGKPDGSSPEARLLALNGALYGTTTAGGATGQGAVFSLKR